MQTSNEIDVSEYRDILKAVCVGDTETASKLIAALDPESSDDLHHYGMAVLGMVVGLHFGEDDAPSAADFAKWLSDSVVDSAIAPEVFEKLIRAFLGEMELLDEISPTDQVDAQYPLLFAIVSESREIREGLDEVLTGADTLFRGWAED